MASIAALVPAGPSRTAAHVKKGSMLARGIMGDTTMPATISVPQTTAPMTSRAAPSPSASSQRPRRRPRVHARSIAITIGGTSVISVRVLAKNRVCHTDE